MGLLQHTGRYTPLLLSPPLHAHPQLAEEWAGPPRALLGSQWQAAREGGRLKWTPELELQTPSEEAEG